jgi:amino acid adenylation domain-containing protein
MSLVTTLKAISTKKAGMVFVSSLTATESLSYSELYKVSLRVLGALQTKGLKAGDELVIQTDDNKEFVCLFWACLLGRIIPVPLAGGIQSEQKLKFFQVWKFLSAPYLACDGKQLERLRSAAAHDVSESSFSQIAKKHLDISDLLLHSDAGVEAMVSNQDIAYIQFSSGSTGTPKGVCLTHENLITNIRSISESLHISDTDKLLNWMPLTHDMGIIGFHLLGVWRGLDTVSLTTNLFIRRPLAWIDLVASHRATVLYSPNFGLQYFLNAFQENKTLNWDLSCVRIIVNGAEPISAELCKQFTTTLGKFGLHANAMLAAYGLAEASVEVSATIPGEGIHSYFLDRQQLKIGDEVLFVDKLSKNAVGFVDLGKVVSDCFLRVANEQNKSLPERTIGHIQVKGGNITQGYYNNETATADIFTSDKWLKTGDLGFMVADRLVVTGRLKNIIIINGQNYYPQDIERIIIDHCNLEQGKVVACGIPKQANAREKLNVFVLHKGTADTFTHIVSAVKEAVFNNVGIQVDDVVAVTKIPKTTSGKIRHFKLVEQYLEDTAAIEEAPSGAAPVALALHDAVTALQLLLREVSALLGRNDIDANADLFDLGINSLAAMQLAERISRLTGRNISIEAIFNHSKILALSSYISTAGLTEQLQIPALSTSSPHNDLSIPQQRIFGEYRLNKQSAAYNIPVVFSIHGDFSKAMFSEALMQLISRHEILRTSFHFADGQAKQKIHEPRESFSFINYIAQSEDGSYAQTMISNEVNRSFLLEEPGQYRTSLFRRNDDSHTLVFVIHHILVDGWSLEIIFHELFNTYNELVKQAKPVAIRPSFQFSDYIAWQLQLADSEVYKNDREYWRNELSGLPAPADLSVVSGRPHFSDHAKVRYHSFLFDAQEQEQLEFISRKYRTSVFSVLLSLLNVIIYRYTNQKDITVGFDIAGRVQENMDSLIGYTLNTLCLRTEIKPTQQFSELLSAVHQKIIQAHEHQLYPFEKMLEDVSAGDSRVGNPLFTILVLFQNFYHEKKPLHLEGCDLKKERVPVQDGFVDLLLEFGKEENGLLLEVHYNESTYTEPGIIRFTQHLRQLLSAVAVDDTQTISRYDMLTPWEKNRFLPQLTQRKSPAVQLPVHVSFEQQVKLSPEKIAIYAGVNSLTYDLLNRRANSIAHHLINTNIQPGDRIGFMVSRNEKIPIAMLAILKAGAAYVALDPEYPVGRCQHIASDSGMKYLLTDRDTTEKIKDVFEQGFLIDMDDEHFSRNNLPDPVCTTILHDLAYVIYTSGSTGQPKGVMIEHASLTGYVQQFSDYFRIRSTDVVLQQASVAFDTIVEEIFPALCKSASVVIAAQGGRDITAILELISSHKVTVLSTTPLVLNEINGQADNRINSLRLLISGGDVLHPFHIDQLFQRIAVYNTYGPSETTVCATYHRVRDLDDAGMIGRPIAGRNIYITDENGDVLPWGRAGEICIEGGLARGYLNQPQLTIEKFVPHPFDKAKLVYRTGDLGRFAENGELIFMGRTDHQLKLNGYRVEPEEVEKVISCYAGVELAIVIPDKKREHLVTCLTVNESYSENELWIFISDRLPYYMIPHQFRVLDKMPVTTTGKIDRKALEEQVHYNPSENKTFRSPSGMLQKRLAGILQTLLALDWIGADDNIFEYGFNSIKATQLKGYVQKELGYNVSIRDIFLFPTVALLAGKIEQQVVLPGMAIDRIKSAASYKLSPSQKRLWLLHGMNKKSFAYNEGEILMVEGDLDPEITKRAFAAVIDRHEILRTNFAQEEAEPYQFVQDAVAHQLNFFHADLSVEEAPIEAARILGEQLLRMPFDLAKGPLYRIALIKVAPEKFLFILGMHHIITDDWSATVIMKEFQQNYKALLNGSFHPLSAAELQYKDYANWANKRNDETTLVKSREYWLNLFHDELPVLDIFPDFPRPAIKQYEGTVHRIELDADLVLKLNNLCRREKISLFMCLLSGLYVLLYRYSRQSDIVVGTPVADREHPDLKDMAGFFINTLPLKIHIGAGDTLRDVWRKVRTLCLDGHEHQSYPLELLVEELKVQRDLSRSPLFDVLINLSSHNSGLSDLEKIRFSRIGKTTTGSKYDLEFYFEEHANGLGLSLVYDKQLFSLTRMEHLLGHYRNILSLFLTEEDSNISTLSYFPEEERNKLLTGFNATGFDFPSGNVAELFVQQVEKNGAGLAVVCQNRSYTYDEINRKAKFLSKRLIYHYGIRPGDKVCLLLDRNEYIAISILAIWKAGAAYVPIDPSFPHKKIVQLINISEAPLVLTDLVHLPVCDALAVKASFKTVCINDTEIEVEKTKGNGYVPNEDGIAYMLFTSGSTGEPKGVEVPHKALSNLLHSLQHKVEMVPGTSMLSVSSYTFDISLSEFFLPLITGAKLLLATTEEVLNVRQLQRLLMDGQPAIMQATPGLWNALVESGWSGSPQLTAITCGEPLNDDLRNKLLDRTGKLWNLYGPTETTIFSSGKQIMSKEEKITIGWPMHNTSLFILDEQQEPVPEGVEGQLYIGGKGLAKGYWKQPALTAEKFLGQLPFYYDRIYATGDVARWLPDGTVDFKGRKDNQVKIRGFRIELHEIEHILLQAPAIQSATVLVKTEKAGDRIIVAFVVADPAQLFRMTAVQSFLRSRLAPYMLPAHYVMVDRIPLTVNGKIDKKMLLSWMDDQPPSNSSDYVAPQTRIETMLTEIWGQILGSAKISTADNFFNIGGNSLKANQLVNHIYNRLSLEITLTDIFNHPTIQQLGALIESLEKEQYDFVELN